MAAGVSSRCCSSGRSLDFSRKLVLGCQRGHHAGRDAGSARAGACALLLFSIAFFCQQSWSGLIMTLPADIFPLSAVGTVAGLVGFGGAIGGAIFGLVAGYLLGHGFSYGTLFVARRNISSHRLPRHPSVRGQDSTT